MKAYTMNYNDFDTVKHLIEQRKQLSDDLMTVLLTRLDHVILDHDDTVYIAFGATSSYRMSVYDMYQIIYRDLQRVDDELERYGVTTPDVPSLPSSITLSAVDAELLKNQLLFSTRWSPALTK